MKTKAQIIERLVKNNHITTKEAVVLLSERSQINLQQVLPTKLISVDSKFSHSEVYGNTTEVSHKYGDWQTDITWSTEEQ